MKQNIAISRLIAVSCALALFAVAAAQADGPPTSGFGWAATASASGGTADSAGTPEGSEQTLSEAMQTIHDLNSRVQALDEALKTIQSLNTRVQALEYELEKAKAASPAVSGAGAPTLLSEQVVTVGIPARETPSPDAENSRIEFFGQAVLDAFYDAKRMDPEWNQMLRPSKIPVGCQESSGCGRDGAWKFGARQSSLGMRASIPTPKGVVNTDISFDLFGVDGSTSIHWLTFWAELGKFGAGQTDSNFMDIDVYPSVNDYWGPSGMVFLRSPQVRFTPWAENGTSLAFSLEAPNSVLDTGKISETSPDFGAGFSSWNRLPDLTASFRYEGDWGHVRAAGILRQVGYQNTSTLLDNPSGARTGYGLNLTGTLNVPGGDQISAGLVVGKGIASYLNDGGFDLAPGEGLHAEAVQSIGWLAYYNHVWAENWSSAIGFSQHLQDNTEGQSDTAFERGSYGTVNLQYTPMKNVLMGLEFGFGELTQKDGQSAKDLRLQSSTRITF